MRFIQYTRKSSEGDERQVQSILDQNAVLERFADARQLNVVDKLEESHSAKQPGTRPIFSKMLEDIEQGKADGILCWHINRLSRNPVDSGALSWLLQQGRIKCILTPDREYRPEDNVVVMAVESAVSNQYVVDLRQSVRRAQLEKASRGWVPRKPPAGYLTNLDTGEIEPDPVRFTLVRRAWDFMLSGNYSVPEIHQLMNEWGFRTRLGRGRSGGPITRANLYKLFDRTFYYGEFTFCGERYTGRHLPMVTRSEFEIVQARLHGKHFVRKKLYFPFSGLIRCGNCGCLITGEKKRKHYPTTNRTVHYTYYHCTRSKKCREPSVTGEFVEAEFLRILRKCQVAPNGEEWLSTVSVDPQMAPAESEQDVFQSELDRLRTSINALYDMRLAGEVSVDEFKQQKCRLQTTVSDMERVLAQQQHLEERVRASSENLLEFLESAAMSFERGDDRDKREVVMALCERVTLSRGTLQIVPHPLLAPLTTLEPPQESWDKVRTGTSDRKMSYWRPYAEHIRTQLATGNVSFPKLQCLQRERLDGSLN